LSAWYLPAPRPMARKAFREDKETITNCLCGL
jgi:hypothetical protein